MSKALDMINRNVLRAMTDDGPPRIRRDMETPILARSRCGKYLLWGGLGPFGVGRMWFKKLDGDENNPTFNEAPIVDIPRKKSDDQT